MYILLGPSGRLYEHPGGPWGGGKSGSPKGYYRGERVVWEGRGRVRDWHQEILGGDKRTRSGNRGVGSPHNLDILHRLVAGNKNTILYI